MDKFKTLKEKIRTINPEFSDELLELLYEYFNKRLWEDAYNNVVEGFENNRIME